MNFDQEKIGKFLNLLRRQAGLTQAEVSRKLDIDGDKLSRWEIGKTRIDAEDLKRLAKVYNITVEEILNCERNTTKKQKKNKIIITSIISSVIFIMLSIIIILSIFFKNNYGKCSVYELYSNNNDYTLNGMIENINNNGFLILSKLKVVSKKFNEVSIISYEYKLMNNETVLYSYGDIEKNLYSECNITFMDMLNNINVYLKTNKYFNINDKLLLIIKYKNNNNVYDEIKIDFNISKIYSNS